jgi:GxxExxY protein
LLEAKMFYEDLTKGILKAFYRVYNTLGHGFLEKVYRNALTLELKQLGFDAQQERSIQVFYNTAVVGEYSADIVVNDMVILELKAAELLKPEHFAQLTNYLKATEKEIGLLLNFGKTPDFKRIIFTNDKKQSITQIFSRENGETDCV